MIRHAVLGDRRFPRCAGRDVLVLTSEEPLARYDGVVWVETALLGDYDVELLAAPRLDRIVNVLWATPKATQLAARSNARRCRS